MRLIDADALEKEFCSGCQYENNKYSNCIDCALAQAPTIEERKTGKWHQRIYQKVEMMVCSECGNEFSYDAETGVRDYNFCPNCGADMRGGNRETP